MKKSLLLILLLLSLSLSVFAHTEPNAQTHAVHDGIGFGAVLAIVISWSNNKSIRWAIIHGVLSWFYVLYYFFSRDEK
ncbi:MAG: hypothetical protein ACK4YV_14430 [Emticicia sp.]